MQHIFSTRNYSVKDFAEWEEREELELVPKFQRPPPRTFGPQGPTLRDLSDAYLQDYQVRQFRSRSTARGRIAHLTAFFGRAARAAALTTHQIRQYQLARRASQPQRPPTKSPKKSDGGKGN